MNVLTGTLGNLDKAEEPNVESAQNRGSNILSRETITPLISVIIPVYNGSKYIQQAIDSILNQTYSNYEIIIIDDGSTDDTREKLQSYRSKIRYLYQENQGSAAARNLGIELAKGELIAFLDSDDYWYTPEKLEKQVAYFNGNPSLGCINTGWRIVDGAGQHIKTVQPWHKAPKLDLETWLRKKCVRTSAMVFRKEWLEKVGGFDEELRQSHDVDLMLRLSLMGCETVWLKEETVCYRQHEENTTKNSLKQAKYVQAVLDKFFSRDDLPESISQMESQIRYHTLVWIAWYQYRAGDLDEMAKFLRKSLDYTSYLKVENIANWLNSFQRFFKERGESFDINSLTGSLQWTKLITNTLTLTKITGITKKYNTGELHTQKSEENANAYFNSVERSNREATSIFSEPIRLNKHIADSDIRYDYSQRIAPVFKKPDVKKYNKLKVSEFPSDLILPPFLGESNDYTFIEKKVENFVAAGKSYSLSVSIIIPYNNNIKFNNFASTLAAIRKQTYPQHLIETVIVNFTKNSEIELLINKYHQKINIVNIKGLEQENFELAAQNVGLQSANNDYLILLENDVLPSPYLVEAYMKYFHVLEKVTLIGDRKFIDGNKISEDLVENDIEAVLNLSNGNESKDWQREDDLKVLNSQHKIYEQSNYLKKDRYPFRAFTSSNVAFPRQLIEKIGFFDEKILHWGYRDREFGYRIYNEGYYFIPVQNALGVHQNLQEGREKQNKIFNHKAQKKLFEQKCSVEWYRGYQADTTYEVPKVSIYIPSYNNAKYIKEAVDSVLNQTYTDVEVCICDDGSTDNTLQVLEDNYRDNPKVRWVAQTNGGIGKSSNTAVRMCRGMYIGQLDSDDVLKPEAVATLVEFLDKENHGCVYSSCERIDAKGNYLQDEYSYPKFSREKMMLTSIAHHFRMFRRRDWLRTDGFNEQLLNAVDYDMFLKLSEVCSFHHLEKMLYLRRWHGKNTSFVNENKQSSNTHIVLTNALERMGLADEWEVYAPDPEKLRKVAYRRKQALTNVFFFPDYRKSNIYQNLMYSQLPDNYTLYSGDIGDALQAIKDGIEKVVFHLHWTNYILKKAENLVEAEKLKNQFLKKLFEFLSKGGKLIWTVHNILPHDCPYLKQEIELRNIICASAQTIHVHSEKSLPEIQQYLNIPLEKIKIVPHGNYVGVYPNTVDRVQARHRFGFSQEQTVFLFLGQIRKYKGIEDLIYAFDEVQKKFTNTHLLIAGKPLESIKIEEINVTDEAKRKITLIQEYIDNDKLQWFFNAADIIALPYNKILTSGSLLNALSFSRPVIAPKVGMTEEVVKEGHNGFLYELGNLMSLIGAMIKVINLKPQEQKQLRQQAFKSIEHLTWNNVIQKLVEDILL